MSNKSKNFLQNLLKPFISKTNKGQTEEDLETIAAQEQKQFPFEILKAATKDFHPTNKLGEGGFGPVYKGKLSDGREIAVKKLLHSSGQGTREFQIEAKLLTRMQHRNVVHLLGYSVHGAEKLLVYEYLSNESLDNILFKSGGQQVLDWKQRHGHYNWHSKGLVLPS
ncbi:Protein kinase superfamily protein [Abeliophyllum distichum]|uniref:Protein kinase superfamily protein n=1 Tax=Abeliophyllum distichum TaxID=126358 RepID=A0ABD1VZ55_9LAMI